MKLNHRLLPISEDVAARAAAPRNSEDRTVDLDFTTSGGVTRFDWWTGERYREELSLDPKHVRMERLERGAPLLAVHNQWDLNAVIGVTERAAIVGERGTATVRFAKTEEGDKALGMVRDGILRNVSVGYLVHRYQKTDAPKGGGLAVWRAIDWEPCEISLVPVPADAGAQIRTEQQRDLQPEIERNDMHPLSRQQRPLNDQQIATLERDEAEIRRLGALTSGPERRAEILDRAHGQGLSRDYIDRMVASDLPLETVCARMVDEVAAQRMTRAPINPTRSNDQQLEPAQFARTAMAEMLLARMGGPAPSEPARQYRDHRMVDMARELLELNGVRTVGLGRVELIDRAMSTSDFPGLLENVASKQMLRGYADFPGGIKRIAKRVLARDFKMLSRLQLAAGSQLEKVLEGGEFKSGKLLEQKSTYQVETFGRILPITRQALINDDLSALEQTAPALGRLCAETENKAFATLLINNAAMGYDNVALFHASHLNLGTGTGSALSETSLAAAKLAMRKQKSLDGTTAIDATPRWLVVPAALEITAQKLLALITPNETAKVNVIPNWALELVVDPRLDQVTVSGSPVGSDTAWYLAADSAILDTIEYANLQDSPGPVLESQWGFVVDGVLIKARLDFGCGAVEHRGLYKANGA